MSIPSYQALKLPLLKFAADGKDHSLAEAAQFLAKECNLTPKQLENLLSSAGQTTFNNRVGWAKTYLKKAQLLDQRTRGYFKITTRGRQVLKQVEQQSLLELSNEFLQQFPEFTAFYKPKKQKKNISHDKIERTNEEIIENAYQQIQLALTAELLTTIKKCTPTYFEELTVKLLVKMGYGGNIKDAGKVTKRSGDEGIDGIIQEDNLGLSKVYIQAKKWQGTVGRPEIQKFSGALEGARADKGVFIITSKFSPGAEEYVKKIGKKIVLIDGERLAGLMIEYDVGVISTMTYAIKSIDTKYFT